MVACRWTRPEFYSHENHSSEDRISSWALEVVHWNKLPCCFWYVPFLGMVMKPAFHSPCPPSSQSVWAKAKRDNSLLFLVIGLSSPFSCQLLASVALSFRGFLPSLATWFYHNMAACFFIVSNGSFSLSSLLRWNSHGAGGMPSRLPRHIDEKQVIGSAHTQKGEIHQSLINWKSRQAVSAIGSVLWTKGQVSFPL